MKILIVDDSPAMQTIIRRSLEKVGYKEVAFQTAGDGREALEIIKTWEPNLIISDWHMPKMTGIELLQELKVQMINVPIGLVTAETSPIRILEAKKAGAVFVIHKPFEIKELQKVVLPVVQGSLEGETLLTSYNSQDDNTDYELQLPSIQAITKIIDGLTIKKVTIKRVDVTGINYNYLPYLLALFSDNDSDVIKAVCILDLRAAAILGCAYENLAPNDVKTIIETKTLNKNIMDNNQRLLKMISALFYDPSTRQDLKLKGVHLIPKPFDRLDSLGSSSSDKRIDLIISVKGYGEGQAILMPVVD